MVSSDDSPPPHPPLLRLISSLGSQERSASDSEHTDDNSSRASASSGSSPISAVKNRLQQQHVPERFQYTMAITNACMTCFLVGHSAYAAVWWYTFKAVTMLSFRYYDFYGKGMHYYMADFCYYANLMLLLYLHVYPSPMLFKAVFAMANGPLASSVLVFNNKLLFTSVQHMISVFIHVSPPLLTWTLRWMPAVDLSFVTFSQWQESRGYVEVLWDLLYSAVPVYVVWLAAYFIVVFCVRSKRISEKHYQTLFSYLMAEKSRSPVKKLLMPLKGTPLLQKIAYMGVHFSFGLLTMLWTPLLWTYPLLHSFFMLLICMAACWNASSSIVKR